MSEVKALGVLLNGIGREFGCLWYFTRQCARMLLTSESCRVSKFLFFYAEESNRIEF